MIDRYFMLYWKSLGKWKLTSNDHYADLAQAFHAMKLFTDDEHKIEFRIEEYKNGKLVKQRRNNGKFTTRYIYSHTFPIYSVYKNDREIGSGTLLDIADQLGVSPRYIQWLSYNAPSKRDSTGTMKHTYRLGKVHIDRYCNETEYIF